MEKNNCIPCTIGVLTYNSEKVLTRCLESLVGFCEIIIADGGSTDKTLAIAKKYGCKIIQQSRQGYPIDDFALERNRTLDVATYDWFFYLDSDEFMSPELKQEIQRIATDPTVPHLVYRVPYFGKSDDLSVQYKQYKTYYQTRLFNKKSGARFFKKIHEKIRFDEEKIKVGKIEAPWFGTLSREMLDFAYYKQKVDHRLSIMAQGWNPSGFQNIFRTLFYDPLRHTMAQVYKMICIRIRYKRNEVMPLRYEFYRIYSHLFLMKASWARIIHLLFKKTK